MSTTGAIDQILAPASHNLAIELYYHKHNGSVPILRRNPYQGKASLAMNSTSTWTSVLFTCAERSCSSALGVDVFQSENIEGRVNEAGIEVVIHEPILDSESIAKSIFCCLSSKITKLLPMRSLWICT